MLIDTKEIDNALKAVQLKEKLRHVQFVDGIDDMNNGHLLLRLWDVEYGIQIDKKSLIKALKEYKEKK